MHPGFPLYAGSEGSQRRLDDIADLEASARALLVPGAAKKRGGKAGSDPDAADLERFTKLSVRAAHQGAVLFEEWGRSRGRRQRVQHTRLTQGLISMLLWCMLLPLDAAAAVCYKSLCWCGNALSSVQPVLWHIPHVGAAACRAASASPAAGPGWPGPQQCCGAAYDGGAGSLCCEAGHEHCGAQQRGRG